LEFSNIARGNENKGEEVFKESGVAEKAIGNV
jgi:hypothetical protein